MARQHFLLIACALSLTGILAYADDANSSAPATAPTATPQPQPPPSNEKNHRDHHRPISPSSSDHENNVSAMPHKGSHDDRFRKNFQMWKKLSPEERDYLRRREDYARHRMIQEIDAAIKKTGLTLTPEQRKQFASRYVQERHKIEEQIHQAMAKMRQPMVDHMIQELQVEFSNPSPTPATTSAPTSSPAPSAK